MKSTDLFFNEQLDFINRALANNTYVMGDFNLDANKSNYPDYHRQIPLERLNAFALNAHLTQIVTFNTWSCTINGIHKDSLLDHVYVKNLENVLNINYMDPTFDDHRLILVELVSSPH